jgi:hypothetical protein
MLCRPRKRGDDIPAGELELSGPPALAERSPEADAKARVPEFPTRVARVYGLNPKLGHGNHHRRRGAADAPCKSKHGSSDDGSVIDYQVESVVLEVISPDNVSGHWQIEHTGFEAGIVCSVKRILARLSHVLRARQAHRVGHIEPVTKRVSA